MQLSCCPQVPARAHGHGLWEEVVRSESAPELPDAPLRSVTTQHKSPVPQGPQERGEGPDFIDKEGGVEKKVPVEFLENQELEFLFTDQSYDLSLNVYLGFKDRLSVPLASS